MQEIVVLEPAALPLAIINKPKAQVNPQGLNVGPVII